MTICLRSLKLNLHPKLCLIKGRRSTSHVGLPKVQSSFLCEFLDSPSEKTSVSLIDMKALMPLGAMTAAWSLNNSTSSCHTFDPSLHMVVMKPLTVTSDDIVLHSNNCRPHYMYCQLLEDDLKMDIIQKENYSVTFLMESLPTGGIEMGLPTKSAFADLGRTAMLSASANDEPKSSATAKDPTGKPTAEQLERVYLRLCEILPKFFTQTHDFSLYHPKVIFNNNIKGVTTQGVSAYVQQLSLLRLVGHLKFAYVKMEILKVTKHPEDGTIRVRWRIRGVPGLKVFLQFWKLKLWNYKSITEKEVDWYDGFSTFYVANDGLIHQHVCDKMMPDEHKEKSTTNLAAKLALVIGFLPRPALDTLGGISLTVMRFHDEFLSIPD